jgi:hypothetical protein
MTTNATRGQEPDASHASQQPTSEADASSRETVHATDEWTLLVRAEGAVEARTHWDNGDPRAFTTAPTNQAPDASATYRYGKTVEGVLARYAHETRFERDTDEHGAALRRGIIDALQSVATDATCRKCGKRATHVRHVNAPTGPKTAIVCDEHATERTYVTNHPLANSREQEGSR